MSHPYMPLYVADYLGDTAHLTTLEHGAYMLLIMTYWQRGGPLPDDPKRLATIARVPTDVWTDVQRTLNEFFTVVDGEWRHERIDYELQKAAEKSEKARKAGKTSAKRRQSQHPSNAGSTDAQRTFSGRSTISDSEEEREEREEITTRPSEHAAAREEAGGRSPSDGMKSDLKIAFNGSTEAMLETIEGVMGPGSRPNAERWLAGTLSAFGRERTSVAFSMLAEKRARNEPIANPLAYWSRTAQGLSAKPPPARSPAGKPTLADVIRQAQGAAA